MAWDKNLPSGTRAWNVADGDIRANNAFLETALQIISTFALNPADPTDRMTGKFASGPAGSRPVFNVAQATGAVYYANDSGQMFICTNGATDTWDELSQIASLNVIGALAAATLNVGPAITDTLTTLALATFTAGARVVTGQTLKGPNGQAWLVDDAGTPQTMIPHSHGSRHNPGGTDGVWQTQRDFIPFSMQRILSTTSILNGTTISALLPAAQSFGAAGVAKASLTLSTAGRPTTSRGLLYAEATARKGAGGDTNDEVIQMGLFRDAIGNSLGATVYRFIEDNVPDNDGFQTMSCWRYVQGLSAGSHEFAMHLYGSDAVAPICVSVNMIYLDLGTE